jgi:hypothetical protein
MPNRTKDESTKTVEFSNFGRRVVQGRFDGGSMTSDGGVMLLNEIDRKLGLTQAAARCICVRTIGSECRSKVHQCHYRGDRWLFLASCTCRNRRGGERWFQCRLWERRTWLAS